jgi:hypothetical protein
MNSQNRDQAPTNSQPVDAFAESGGSSKSTKESKLSEGQWIREKVKLHVQIALSRTLASIAALRNSADVLARTENSHRQPHEQFAAQLRRLFGEQENVTIVSHIV